MLGRRTRRYRREEPERPRELQIGWVNVGKGAPAHNVSLNVAYDQGIDILCVQEPYTHRGNITQNHPGYTFIAPVEAWDGESDRPRVLTYIKRDAGLKASLIGQRINRDLLWVKVNGYSILNVY